MRKFMFGLDESDLRGSAEKLVKLGYDTVVVGVSPMAIKAAKGAGLETWVCYGAHSMGEYDKGKYGAKDFDMKPADWFWSACPNNKEINEHNMDKAISVAADCGADGIFVDGARFASFASEEGVDSFFGCFCNNCHMKYDEFNMDYEKTRRGISELYAYLHGGRGDITAMRSAVDTWLSFRARCVHEYVNEFVDNAHKNNLKAGAFVFAPSLWRFVGQVPESLSRLDIVSPMLYRDYPHNSGTACLGHEWDAFSKLIHKDESIARDIFDTVMPCTEPMKGFSPEHVGQEVAAAKESLPSDMFLAPIVQAEDDKLDEVMNLVYSSGADACGEFAYSLKYVI